MRCLYCGRGDWSDYTTYQRQEAPDEEGNPGELLGNPVYVCKKHQPLTKKQIEKLEKRLDG